MSFKVLVIPEDPTNNGYILQPLVEKMFEKLGKPNAQVKVLTNPRITGKDHAAQVIRDELDRYNHFSIWLFLRDADFVAPENIAALQSSFNVIESRKREQGVNLFCCAARPEVEIWAIAGHINKLRQMGWTWNDARTHPTAKETIFEPFLREHGNPRSAGGGRQELMRETLNNYQGLLDRCDELKELHRRLSEYLQSLQ